ncbi:hypothetical protein [Pseudonocardia sp.]|jgi:hypothetical protein|uniref:hypothetical protein n=1 Tax=Pseudonocardia sp. TaxID=60912 RepID=UPI0031FC8422
MPFVHGHPRDLTWVKGHYRAPNSADDGQLGLDLPAPAPDLDDLLAQPREEPGDQGP